MQSLVRILCVVVAMLLPCLAADNLAGSPLPTLYLVGDSTMADKPVIPANAERGWGQTLPAFFKETLRIENHAMNGRSSQSFLSEGRWAAITNQLRAGDWVIVQFGHNDEKKADNTRFTPPFGQFKTNLTRYLVEARALGARPILATSVVRRSFDKEGKLVDTHGDYIVATREVAREQNAPLLDLNARSAEVVQALGPQRSEKLYLWVGPDEFPDLKEAKKDNTHFCAYGATRMCDVAVEEIKVIAPDLAKHLRTGKPR